MILGLYLGQYWYELENKMFMKTSPQIRVADKPIMGRVTITTPLLKMPKNYK